MNLVLFFSTFVFFNSKYVLILEKPAHGMENNYKGTYSFLPYKGN